MAARDAVSLWAVLERLVDDTKPPPACEKRCCFDCPLCSGMTTRRSSSPLAVTSCDMLEMSVVLPPGRARLAIRPAPTGSISPVITTGIVRAGCCAERAAAIVVTTIRLDLR